MPRTARASIGGLHYHALSRGNDKKRVFLSGRDFDKFLGLAIEAAKRHPTDILAYCLMPNHFHFVVRPRDDQNLSRWMHLLLTNHAQWHRLRYQTTGHIWQGRFKAFPIQDDGHLLTVMRYVERNALRAGLVRRAEHWRWGSLSVRGTAQGTFLARSPCDLGENWLDSVNATENESKLRVVRRCIANGRPFGSTAWAMQAALRLGLEFSLRPPGRPRKVALTDTGSRARKPNESRR